MRRKIIATIITVAALIWHGTAQAGPYDICAQILKNGAFNTSTSISNASYQSVFRDYLCSQSTRNEANSTKFDTAVSVLVPGLYGSSSADFNQSGFESWKQSSCQLTERYVNASSASYDYLQVADSGVVEAWKSCVAKANSGMACWAEPIGPSRIIFKIRGGSGAQNTIRNLNITPVNAAFESALPSEIQEGAEYPVVATHSDTADSAIFLVTGTGDRGATSCTYAVPPKIQLPELTRFDFERTANLSLSYLVEFSKPVTIREGRLMLGGQSFAVSTGGAPSRFLAGSLPLQQYPMSYTPKEYQALYWSCQAERGCPSGDLSCVNGCREQYTDAYEKSQRAKNAQMQALYDNPGTVRINLVDSFGQAHYGEWSRN